MGELRYELGMIGLGVMGRNLLLNMADHRHAVAGYDKEPAKIEALAASSLGRPIRGVGTPAELLSLLAVPRAVLLLVPAGPPVDEVVGELLPHLQEKDILIDCGNSHFADTDRRQKALAARGISLLGVGVSGGESGARHGPSIMPGGPRDAYERVRHLFEDIAAHVAGEPCVTYLGPGSAGHFVKMVHNGIEYGLMELIAEAYDVMRYGMGMDNDDMAATFKSWNDGGLRSYLIEITARILPKPDEKTGGRLVDMILDAAGQKGTGKWTSVVAKDLQLPVPVIDAAVSARDLSGLRPDRETASRLYPRPQTASQARDQGLIDELERSLLAGFLTTFAQGMALLRRADAFGYGLNLAEVARIWRGGCIVRAALLDELHSLFQERPELGNLLLDPRLGRKVLEHRPCLRNVVCFAADCGIPVPAMMAALAYFDGYRSRRLPANLIQAQRDFFGAHTYERVDEGGSFHTRWEEE